MDTLDPRINTALVTGSARRNGRALALWLAKQGVRVAVHFRASQAEAEAVAAECSEHTAGAISVQGDITDPAQAQIVVEKCIQEFGGLQVLVNNVGYQGVLDLPSDDPAAVTGGKSNSRHGFSIYDVPPLLQPDPEKVLVVGAGTGNDVAAMLRNGAEHVVECHGVFWNRTGAPTALECIGPAAKAEPKPQRRVG